MLDATDQSTQALQADTTENTIQDPPRVNGYAQFLPEKGSDNIIQIRGTSSDAIQATLIANLYAEEYVRLTEEASRSYFSNLRKSLEEREKEVRPFIQQYADLFDLDPNLVRGLITQESRFIAEATSPTGAYGYGQFTHIGARQVQNIAEMTDKAGDLADFTKQDAGDPDRGIKAICATLWWLFNKKYDRVGDKKIQLEAVLTFYNSGGRPAALVIKHGGHAEAVPYLKELPKNIRSQSLKYAPEVAAWFVSWHEHMVKTTAVPAPAPVVRRADNPFDDSTRTLDIRYKALVQALLLLANEDASVDSVVNSRDGLTELTLIFPGEFE